MNSENPGSTINELENDKWRLFTEQAADAIIVYNDQGKIQDVNPCASQILGYSHDELLHKSIQDFDCDYSPDLILASLQKRKPGISYTINTHIRRKDSSIFPAESRQSCFIENGNKFFINLVRDISDREKDQQDLLQMQTRIQFATQAANIGIWECNFDTKQLIWDDRMLELHGITRKKPFLMYDDWFSMVHPDDRLSCRKIIKQILKTGVPVDFEYRIVLPDSSIRVIRSFGQFITLTGNKPSIMIGINQDVTDKKWLDNANQIMEKAQWQIIHAEKESEIYSITGENIQKIVNNGYISTFILNETRQTLQVNNIFGPQSRIQQLIDKYKIDPKKITFKLNEFPEYTLQKYRSGKLELFEGGVYLLAVKKVPKIFCLGVEKGLGITSLYTMGFVREKLLYGGLIIAATKEITPVLNIIESIANMASQAIKKMRSETSMRESEDRFRSLFDDSPISLWEEDFSVVKQRLDVLRAQGVTDFKTYFALHPDEVAECGRQIKILNLNKASVKLLHAKSKDQIMQNMHLVFGGEEYSNFTNELIAIAEGRTNFEWEGVNFAVDGTPLILNIHWSAAPKYKENLAKVIVSVMDVTERRQADQLLSEKEHQLSTLMSNLPGMVYRCLIDANWTIQFASEGVLALTGYTAGDLLHQKINYNDLILPEDRSMVFTKIEDACKANLPFKLSYRIRTKKGKIKWVYEQGRIIGQIEKYDLIEGFITDITEQKLAEQSNALLLDVQKQMVQLSEPAEICLLVGQRVSDLLGDAFVLVTSLIKNQRTTKLIGHFGMEDRYNQLVSQFNLDLSNLQFDLSEYSSKESALLRNKDLIKFPFGLYNLLSRKIPETVCLEIEREMNHLNIYTISFIRQSFHFGNLLIFTSSDISRFKETIETVVNQATVLINRLNSEDELRESEERFRQIFEECPVGIALSNSQLRITNVNPMFTKILGYSQNEIFGRTFNDITYSEDIPQTDEIHREFVKAEIPFLSFQKRYIHKNGSLIWANITVTAIRGHKGELISGLVMIDDITEKKQAAEALQHEQYLMQTLMDNIPDSVYFKDTESRFIRVNQATVKKFGLQSTDEILGKTDADFFPAEIAQEALIEEQQIIQTGNPVINQESIEIWNDRRSNTWSSNTKMVLKDKTGQVMGTFGVSRDTTDRKAKEEEIKRLNADLEKRVESRTKELNLRNQELEAFTYSISHDLKAPLRGIIGYSQLLLQEHTAQLDEEGKSFLDKLVQSSDQLNQLIDDLLNYSLLERRPTSYADFSINEIVNAVVEERASVITENGIVLHKEIEEEIINSSPELITHIIRSYVDNAIKYSSKKRSPEIWLTYKKGGDTSLLMVKDNGIGFDSKYNEKIFEVFYRLQRLDQYPGTGMGLAMVKKAAEILKYRVWAKGEVDMGSTFYLEIKKNPDLAS